MGYTTMRGGVLRMKVLCKVEHLVLRIERSTKKPAMRVAPDRCCHYWGNC